jgi:hypothetical protein
MHLPEFVLLVLATIAAIAAGLAVLASKYSIARVLFWIAAASFGSLGVLWSASSEGYSLKIQLLVAGIVGAIAAVGITWALWEIREKETAEKAQKAHAPPAIPASTHPALTTPGPEDRWTWVALTDHESEEIYSRLRDRKSRPVFIGCNRAECMPLASSLDQLFRRLGWPRNIADPGIAGIGLTGLMISPNDETALALKEALQATTRLRPDVGGNGAADAVWIMIGAKPEIMPAGPLVAAIPARGPTLEATNHSVIDAKDAKIAPDLPFPLARADDHSMVAMGGFQMVKTEKGYELRPGTANMQFPAPPPKYAVMANADVQNELHAVAGRLRELQSQYSEELKQTGYDREKWRAVSEKYRLLYEDKFAQQSFDLAAAVLSRVASIQTTGPANDGALLVFYKKFAGPTPAGNIADFLEFLADHIPKG